MTKSWSRRNICDFLEYLRRTPSDLVPGRSPTSINNVLAYTDDLSSEALLRFEQEPNRKVQAFHLHYPQ
jgi:hypothetical protein